MKCAQSVNLDINMCVLTSRCACLEVRFGFKEKIGSLSELGSFPVIFISMCMRQVTVVFSIYGQGRRYRGGCNTPNNSKVGQNGTDICPKFVKMELIFA